MLQQQILTGKRCGYCQARTTIARSGLRADCLPCGAYVGIATNGCALGRVARAPLRQARQLAHVAFDPIWRSGQMSRAGAYLWLSGRLDIPLGYCHIGMFGEATCDRVVAVAREYLAQLAS